MCNRGNQGLSVRCCSLWTCREDALSNPRDIRPSFDTCNLKIFESRRMSSRVHSALHGRGNPFNQIHRSRQSIILSGKILPVENPRSPYDEFSEILLKKQISTLTAMVAASDLTNDILTNKLFEEINNDPSGKIMDKLVPRKIEVKLLDELDLSYAQAIIDSDQRISIIPIWTCFQFSLLFMFMHPMPSKPIPAKCLD